MIRIAICDDDKELIVKLKQLIDKQLKNFGEAAIVDCYTSGEFFLERLFDENVEYDAVFMDIYLDGISGFTVVNQMNSKNYETYIIFITSDSELVYECFDYKPFNFIRKDMYQLKLPQVLNKLIFELKHQKIWEIKLDGHIKSIKYNDIIYIQRINRRDSVHTISDNYYISTKFNELEEKLKPLDFIRIHRKNIVNLKYIADINSNLDEVVLKDKTRLEMSRYMKKDIIEKYRKYIRKV